jgi:hypothetical protein
LAGVQDGGDGAKGGVGDLARTVAWLAGLFHKTVMPKAWNSLALSRG